MATGSIVGFARIGIGQFNIPHNIAIDRQDNVYVADRGNNRIQVFDGNGNTCVTSCKTCPTTKRGILR